MYVKYLKRAFDILLSLFGIIVLSPVMVVVTILIVIDSGFPVIYKQKRITMHRKEFYIYKFRTMRNGADKLGVLTANNDSRVTKIGRFLRKSKLDELPQLFNVLIGDMSFVGPRPETPQYVNCYKEEWLDVFEIRPGITDYASIHFSNESEYFNKGEDPGKVYLEKILPAKMVLKKKYLKNITLFGDIKIILLTVFKVAGIKVNVKD